MGQLLGEMLHAANLISFEQLQHALTIQKTSGGCLASILCAMQILPERTLARFLSAQLKVPFVVLGESSFGLKGLAKIPRPLAEKHRALVLQTHQKEILVALAEPQHTKIIDEIRFVTAGHVVAYGALQGVLEATLQETYNAFEEGRQFWTGKHGEKSSGLEENHIQIVSEIAEVESAIVPSVPLAEEDIVIDLGDLGAIDINQLPETPKRPRRTILVVDDDEGIRSMLTTYFVKLGYDVSQAEDGSVALASLSQELPDLIVLDAMLPGVHGFEICQKVKNSPSTSHIPVVMISAVYRGKAYADDAVQSYGADAFLEKPLSLRKIKEVVSKSLSQTGLPEESEDWNAKAEAAIKAAAEAFAEGKIKEAVTYMEQAVAASPFSALLHRRLALLYQKLNEPYLAISALEQAAQLDPSAENHLLLAELLERLGFIHKALESYRTCLRLTDEESQKQRIQEKIRVLSK